MTEILTSIPYFKTVHSLRKISQGREKGKRREWHGRVLVPSRENSLSFIGFVNCISFFTCTYQNRLNLQVSDCCIIPVHRRKYYAWLPRFSHGPVLILSGSCIPTPPGYGLRQASPRVSTPVPGSRRSLSPLWKRPAGQRGVLTCQNPSPGQSLSGIPNSFSHGLMLRLKNCHQLWAFTPLGDLP